MFKGFVPITVDLASELGVYGAYLYGYMWLKRDRENRFSEAKATIAKNLNITKQTVLRYTRRLIEAGYIVDESPEGNGKCVYRITGKADFSVSITIKSESKIIPRRVNDIDPSELISLTPCSQRYLPMNHDDMMHGHGTKMDPPTLQKIRDLWSKLGFDEGALSNLLKQYDNPDDLLRLLQAWADEWEHLPESWGYGLIYRKLQRGERPPEREKTFFEEVLEAMELRRMMEEAEDDV